MANFTQRCVITQTAGAEPLLEMACAWDAPQPESALDPPDLPALRVVAAAV